MGENLQDHIFTPVSLISDEIIGVDENMTNSYMVRLQHLLFGTGIVVFANSLFDIFSPNKLMLCSYVKIQYHDI